MLLFIVGMSEYKQRAWNLESKVLCRKIGFCVICSSWLKLWQPSCSRWYFWHGALTGFGKKKSSFWGQNRFDWDQSLSEKGAGLGREEKYFLRVRRISLRARTSEDFGTPPNGCFFFFSSLSPAFPLCLPLLPPNYYSFMSDYRWACI